MSSQSGSHTHVAGAVNNSAADTSDDASKDNQKKTIHVAAILFFIFIPFTADER